MLLYSAAFQKNVAPEIAMKKCVEMVTCRDLMVINFMPTFEGKQTLFAWFWSIHFEAKQKQNQRIFFWALVLYLSHQNSCQSGD